MNNLSLHHQDGLLHDLSTDISSLHGHMASHLDPIHTTHIDHRRPDSSSLKLTQLQSSHVVSNSATSSNGGSAATSSRDHHHTTSLTNLNDATRHLSLEATARHHLSSVDSSLGSSGALHGTLHAKPAMSHHPISGPPPLHPLPSTTSSSVLPSSTQLDIKPNLSGKKL